MGNSKVKFLFDHKTAAPRFINCGCVTIETGSG